MDLNWFESIIYGFISGVAEFLPISSYAHQQIFLHLIGCESRDPIRDLFVHIALLSSLYTSCRTMIGQIRRDRAAQLRRRQFQYHNSRNLLDLKVVQNASICMVLSMLLFSFIFKATQNLLSICFFLLLNGIVIFLSGRTLQGNKDARSMSFLDSFLIGVSGSLSCLPGMSRIGLTTTCAISRGADKRFALNWSLLISISALILLCFTDFISIFLLTGTLNVWGNLFTYGLSAISAYLGGYLSVLILKIVVANYDFSKFAYYNWGSALFTFIIYLTVV